MNSVLKKPAPGAAASATPLVAALGACRGALFGAALFSCVINVLMLTGPLFMLQVYDRVLASRSVPTLVVLTVLVAGLFVILGVLDLLRSRILSRVGQRVDEQIHAPLFAAVIDHSVRRTPHIHGQPLRDLDTVRQFLGGPSPGTIFDLPWTPLYLLVVFLLHVYLGVFALAGALVLAVLAVINDLATRGATFRSHESAGLSHRVAEECRRNASAIKAMGMLPAIQARWQRAHGRAIQDQISASDRNGVFSVIAKIFRLFLQSAILALGAYLVILQEMTPGAIIASSVIMARALAPIEQGISHWRGLLQFRDAYRRLRLVFADIEQQSPKMELPTPKGRVAARGVTITAPGDARPILRDIAFTLEPGQALGIIGPTGAGKSTLARALANVWPLAAGKICVDGVPYEQWDSLALGRAIGYLPQDVALFEGTFDENIARFDVDRRSEDVLRAARLAGVHQLILRFPDGYKTQIGEGGVKLSAGQRQRIGLARALYGRPALLIMDEPNANLDAAGEEALVQAIRQLKNEGTTVIVIAHRPSAIAAVDLLLYLDEGRQIAFGPKQDVLRNVLDNGAHVMRTFACTSRMEAAHG